jgi:DNA-binding XRE family transcriptional regulator
VPAHQPGLSRRSGAPRTVDRSSLDYWVERIDPAVFADATDDQRRAAADAARRAFDAELEMLAAGARPDYEPNLRLAHALVDDGRTRKRLAADIGVSHQWLCRVFTGTVQPSASLRRRIAAALGRPELELFDDADLEVPA